MSLLESRRSARPLLLVASTVLLAACGGGRSQTVASAAAAPTAGSARHHHAKRVPDGDWTRFDYNAQRSGVGPGDTGINPGNVRRLKRRTVRIDGVADSSAVQVHGVKVHGRARDVIVLTTTYGKTIAIDPGSGAKLWEFRPSDLGSYQGSPQITVATPVVDPDRSHVYVASPDGRIHKLVLATGQEVRSGGWPVSITFDPTKEKIGGALNISGSSVVAVTGGYVGDFPVYQGHVVLIDRSDGHVTHVFNTLCSNRHYLIDPPSSCPATDSAIWARAGAVIEPGSGRILVATGNGPFNGSTNWGDSVLELTPDASTLLHNWTPTDQAYLNSNDLDLGSTAPALLPKRGGYRLAVQGGKAGKLSLLNLNRLDGTTGGPGPRTGGEIQDLSTPGGDQVLTAPAVWTRSGRPYVFVGDNSGTAAYVLRLSGGPHLALAWHNSTPGTSPLVAGGLLYVYDDVDGVLKIYRPESGATLASLPAGTGHWSSPIVIGGRIILPVGGSTSDDATKGDVYIYHLPGR